MARTLFFKPEVRLAPYHFAPVMTRILQAAIDTAPPTHDGAVVVTSANDGEHKQGSLHYTSRAFDLRTIGARPGGLLAFAPQLAWPTYVQRQQAAAKAWVAALQARLGDDYDVAYEHNHIHVEYDPK